MEQFDKNSPSLGREAIYEKMTKISKLPYYLPIQFVRFFWRQDKNVRAKICKPVDFPFRLDLFEYCDEELQKSLAPNREAVRIAEEEKIHKNRGKKEEEEKKEEGETKQEDTEMKDAEEVEDAKEIILENDTGLYDLVGVISHRGRSADGGHYVAWVKKDES